MQSKAFVVADKHPSLRWAMLPLQAVRWTHGQRWYTHRRASCHIPIASCYPSTYFFMKNGLLGGGGAETRAIFSTGESRSLQRNSSHASLNNARAITSIMLAQTHINQHDLTEFKPSTRDVEYCPTTFRSTKEIWPNKREYLGWWQWVCYAIHQVQR